MCGRFTMTRRDKTELAALLGVPGSELGDYTPRFNIAPTTLFSKQPTRAAKRFRRYGAW
jgi:putative SOS response-associated peptidase YedK